MNTHLLEWLKLNKQNKKMTISIAGKDAEELKLSKTIAVNAK